MTPEEHRGNMMRVLSFGASNDGRPEPWGQHSLRAVRVLGLLLDLSPSTAGLHVVFYTPDLHSSYESNINADC